MEKACSLAVVDSSVSQEAGSIANPFTARENEILNLLRAGASNREIAENLNIQEVTVRFHLRNLYQKTGLATRDELIAQSLGASDVNNRSVKSG